MCLICIEQQKLSVVEMRSNLREMRSGLPKEHIPEVEKIIHERVWEEIMQECRRSVQDYLNDACIAELEDMYLSMTDGLNL